MTNTTSPDADDQRPSTDDWNRADPVRDRNRHPDRESPDCTAELVAVVVEGDDGPDECTIYPTDASEEDLVTTWISAEEGAYVDLDEMR